MRNRGGFTIVESLIALAISSALFVIMMVMFNGRQARVEFSQGMRDIEAYILDVANDVRNGYYPNSNQKCIVNSGVLSFDPGIPAAQGTSSDCIFAGKILLFDGASSPFKISDYSLAASKSTTSLVAADSNSSNLYIIGSSGNETKTDYTLPGGISLVKQDLTRASLILGLIFDINNVGVESSNKKITSVVPYAISSVNISAIRSSTFNSIDSTGKTLCFLGSNGQTGTIIIKRGPDGLSTSLQIGQSLTGVPCTAGV